MDNHNSNPKIHLLIQNAMLLGGLEGGGGGGGGGGGEEFRSSCQTSFTIFLKMIQIFFTIASTVGDLWL